MHLEARLEGNRLVEKRFHSLEATRNALVHSQEQDCE